jgi:hyperosmotically inducible protein
MTHLMNTSRAKRLLSIIFSILSPAMLASTTPSAVWQQPLQPRAIDLQPVNPARAAALTVEVRRRVVMSIYYDMFGWLEGEVRADGTTILRGQVLRSVLKTDTERIVRGLQGVTQIDNQIEILPLSPSDDLLRVALFGQIYGIESPLFKYITRDVPPVHIIVKNGRVTLIGSVATEIESRSAYQAAMNVPNAIEITNLLTVEAPLPTETNRHLSSVTF